MTCYVVTVQSHAGGHHTAFLASAHRFGVTPAVLTPSHWGGLTTKLQTLARWLKAKRLPEEDLLLFADAWDVVFVRSLDGLKDTFASFGAEIVFSAEMNCAPYPQLADRYPACDPPYRFLNSGLYVGRVGAIATLFEDMGVMRLPPAVNDQGVLSDFFLSHPGRIVLDTECRLFGSLYQAEEDYEYGKDGVRNVVTGAHPYLLHANGTADFSRTLAWLGLAPTVR